MYLYIYACYTGHKDVGTGGSPVCSMLVASPELPTAAVFFSSNKRVSITRYYPLLNVNLGMIP